MTKPYLNVGCGFQHHPDWVNIDFVATGNGVIAHNLRSGLPFADSSFQVIYHSHLLEHLPKTEAEKFLKECIRVLQPQGVIRVVVPDLEAIVRLYLTAFENAISGSPEWSAHYDWLLLEMYDQCVRHQSGGEMLTYLDQEVIPNQEFVVQRLGNEAESLINFLQQKKRDTIATSPSPLSEDEEYLKQVMGEQAIEACKIGLFRMNGEPHQWMYDRYSLRKLLHSVGFINITVCKSNESSIPEFTSYHLDTMADGKTRKPDSLFIEANKPVHGDITQFNTNLDSQIEFNIDYTQIAHKNIEKHHSWSTWTELASHITQQLQTRESQLLLEQRQLELKLCEAKNTIAQMESSKFWKLRNLWFSVKRFLYQAQLDDK